MAYGQVIRDLGGDVSTEASFDISATHLLCIRLSRNDKILGSIAAGKWVLHCMYLRDSELEGKFLDVSINYRYVSCSSRVHDNPFILLIIIYCQEEKYEWGNPKSSGVIPDPTGEIEETIAAAAYKWRLKLLKEPSGPFHNMVALLLTAADKYDQFQRLIEAGGGKVVQAR